MFGRALATLLFAVFVLSHAPAQSTSGLDSIIAHCKQVEAQQAKLYDELNRGTVVMVHVTQYAEAIPMRTSEIRDAILTGILLGEANKANPDFEKAEARAKEAADRFIADKKEESRARLRALPDEMSRVRTMRQKAERQRDLLKAHATGGGNYSGTWSSDWGKMVLTQSGNHVSGTYEHANGKLDGDIGADGVLHFRWTQSNAKGIGEFRMDKDGRSFTGTWHYTDDAGKVGGGGGWRGTRG